MRQPLGDRLNNRLDDNAHRLRRVIIAWDWVRELGRIRIRIDQTDRRNVHALGLSHRDFFVAGIDDEHRARQPGDVSDTIKIARHAGHLAANS